MTEPKPVPTAEDRKLAEHIFQSQAPGPEIKWGHCSVCDATLSRVSELIAAYRVRLLEIPESVWKRYDESVDKAHSVGAMKMLKNMEAEIGRIFIARIVPSEATSDAAK